MPSGLQLGIIACAVLEAEIRHFAADDVQIVAMEFLDQALHSDPAQLKRELQTAIHRTEQRRDIDAIALGYGLCNRATEGVTSKRCKVVIPRAYDCITLLLGSKERYAEYVTKHPGTFWYSPGWNRCEPPPGPDRYRKTYCEYCDRFGAEQAERLIQLEKGWTQAYKRAAYVHLGIGATPEDVEFTRDCADWLKWDFDIQAGDTALLRCLLKGEWDKERFVTLMPGQTFQFTADSNVIEAMDVAKSDE